jgi:TnpA family transposase
MRRRVKLQFIQLVRVQRVVPPVPRESVHNYLRIADLCKELGIVVWARILRKFGSYPRQNGLALALGELGHIERTLFMLEWLQNPALRRRVKAGLNKAEAKNALARAVSFNRLGELRTAASKTKRYRARA